MRGLIRLLRCLSDELHGCDEREGYREIWMNNNMDISM
jgi:hypothetical protein